MNALDLALACQNAYADEPFGQAFDFEDCRAVITKNAEGEQVVAVRGTRPVVAEDDLRDLMAALPCDDKDIGWCALGFNQGASGLWKVLNKAIDPGAIFCGHSLGGAMAANLALRAVLAKKDPSYCFLLEPARSIGERGGILLSAAAPGKVLVNGNDPVPKLPPQTFYARHPYPIFRYGKPRANPIECHLMENILPLLEALNNDPSI
jgi:hypothetical protein